jgi:ATP-dependent Clp protease ATP-binding subunit ClpA
MFERFTERSRHVVVLAQEEARLLDHNYIGTEHILLALIHERQGVAARVITSAGLSLEEARAAVEQTIGRGKAAPVGHIPFTPRAKKILELSLVEALEQKKNYISTEHILLGLLREGQGAGAQILERFAGPASAFRQRVIAAASAGPADVPVTETDVPAAAGAGWPAGWPRPLQGWGPFFRAQTTAIHEIRETLTSIDRRLAAIERHLGIAEEPPAAGETPPASPAASPAAEGPAEPDEPDVPGGSEGPTAAAD